MTSTAAAPQRRFKIYNKTHLKFDLVAAIAVFLVAIPFCLGIALASGAPLFSGLVSGIIGGVIVGLLSGSQASVSGPSAGMAAVAFTAIAQLGSFEAFLLALTFAGILQLFLGIFRAGIIADYLPANVIQGLLCAIGILLIIKQLPLAFSHAANSGELQKLLLSSTEGISLQPLLHLQDHLNAVATVIAFTSFLILCFFDRRTHPHIKNMGPLVVLISGILLNELFTYSNAHQVPDTPQWLNIPSVTSLDLLLKQLHHPDFNAITNPAIYLHALIIALIASLETLLNLKAIEKIDRKHRNCSADRELFAQGIGNLTAGLLGGIPLTSVIVRTSVNIQAGSKSKMSAILQGLLLAFSLLLIPNVLNKIPLSSLAALLVYTGYKLARPSLFIDIYRQGWDRFIPFIITVISIVVFNILAGILLGLATSLLYILKSNSEARLNIMKEIYPTGITYRLLLPQQVTFLNKASFIAELNAIPRHSQLIIDARNASYIDKEIIELMHEFKREQAPTRQIALNFEGFKDHYNIHNVIDFIKVTTYDIQANLRPEQVLNILQEGNQRFLQDMRIHRSPKLDMQQTAKAQHPIAVVLGCIDSRVPVETIFDMTFGDIFCIRVAGNVINMDVIASMEYACHVVKAKLIVVLGHTRCGAIQSACDGVQEGNITRLLAKIKPAIAAETETQENRTGQNMHFVNQVIHLNVANALQHIYQKSPILSTLVDNEEIGIAGAVYDVNSGTVHFKDYSMILDQFSETPNASLKTQLHLLLKKAGMASL